MKAGKNLYSIGTFRNITRTVIASFPRVMYFTTPWYCYGMYDDVINACKETSFSGWNGIKLDDINFMSMCIKQGTHGQIGLNNSGRILL